MIVARAPGDTLFAASLDADATHHSAQGVQIAIASRRAEIENASPTERLDLLRELVRNQVAQILRLDPANPPALHDRFMDIGMDSLMAVQLRNRLTTALELERRLPSTLIFDHPTIAAVAEHLFTLVSPAVGAPERPAKQRVEPVAVVDRAAVAAMSDEEIARLLESRATT